MKTVFSNQELCHVWASQNQERGRNSGDTLFFTGNEIYSYGSHYLAAKIFNVGGKNIVLVNNYNYSSATCGQLAHVRRAITHLDSYSVPNPDKIKCLENFNHFNNGIFDSYYSILRTSKVSSESNLEWQLEYFESNINEANKFFELAGYDTVSFDALSLDILKEHLQARFERYKVLNTPEMILKRDNARTEKQQRERLHNILRNQINRADRYRAEIESLENFRAGKSFGKINSEYELLRVVGKNVETSGHANVPLFEAIIMLKSILSGEFKVGDRVGHFKLDNIDNSEDSVITIGCHDILLSEAKTVLSEYIKNGLSLVPEKESSIV